MTLEILVRYLHFIGIFTWVSALVLQWFLVKPVLLRQQVQQLARIDAVYGLSAIVVVGMGLTLVRPGQARRVLFPQPRLSR